jgi:hypothetical protein
MYVCTMYVCMHVCTHIIRIKQKCLTRIISTGWQWMHVDVQIMLARCAGHAESRRDPQPEDRIFSLFGLLVERNIDW